MALAFRCDRLGNSHGEMMRIRARAVARRAIRDKIGHADVRPAAHLLLPLLAATRAFRGSSSDWYEAEGARVRLVTTGARREGIVARRAGDRPQARLENLLARPGRCRRAADDRRVGKPQCRLGRGRFRRRSASTTASPNGRATTAGAFPVSFTLADPKAPATIEAKVFLGVCETICMPVQAALTVDPLPTIRTMPSGAALDARARGREPDFGAHSSDGRQGRGAGRAPAPARPERSTSSWRATTATSSARPSGRQATAMFRCRSSTGRPAGGALTTPWRRRRGVGAPALAHARHPQAAGVGGALAIRQADFENGGVT